MTETLTRHNHDRGKAMPFGRLKPVGDCPRCDELHDGAPARELPWDPRANVDGWPSDARISEHFAPGGIHATGGCGPVCTFGDR